MATDTQAMARREQNTAIANHEDASAALSHILGTGDLAQLSDEQRVGHYLDVCQSLGLNPRTRPFDWIEFYDPETKGKKLTLYPNRSCAEQLRRQHQISIRVVRREPVGELFVVEVEGTTPTGRVGTASKYVSVLDRQGQRLRGNQLANAYMKAETGAFRRLTFSMVGMASPPDLDELSRPKVVVVDGTGRVLDNPTEEQKALAADPDMARVLREPTYETTAQAADAPLSGHASQAPTIDELTPSARPGPAVSLRCDANKWRAAYFGATADTHLETAEGRREFLARYTADYTPALRTDSLSDFLKRATDSQAEQMTVAARAAADDLRANDQPSQHDDPKVHASVLLTGGSITADEPELDEDAQYEADMMAELERDRERTQGAAF